MKQILSPYAEASYALLRIVSGFLFFCHGAQKFGWTGGEARELFSLIGLAGLIEVVAGLLLILGLMTGIAAFLSSGLMAVAYFMVHQPTGAIPIIQERSGELAMLYCFLFFFIAMKGAGQWSLDNRA